MYTRRNYSVWGMIKWTRRYILQFLLISTIPVILYDTLGWEWLHLPWSLLIDHSHDNIIFDFIAHNFVWLSIPFSVIIAWAFYSMERIGDVSKNPFEGIANDVPITSMSRAIEVDIRQIIGDDKEQIPELIKPKWDIQM